MEAAGLLALSLALWGVRLYRMERRLQRRGEAA
jgi:hypothetical protein